MQPGAKYRKLIYNNEYSLRYSAPDYVVCLPRHRFPVRADSMRQQLFNYRMIIITTTRRRRDWLVACSTVGLTPFLFAIT